MGTESNFNIEFIVKHHNILPNNVHRLSFMNFLYLNAQSLRNSLTDLQDFINSLNYQIHVVLVTETWIKDNEKIYYNLINFHAFHSTRPNGNGGGISIFIHNNFDTGNILFEESINNNNILLISLIKHQLNIALCYRQPNNPQDLNCSLFLNKLDILLSAHKKIMFFGDFNINIFNNSTTTDDYKNILQSNGLTFVNSLSHEFPTRISHRFNSSTCIDHIFTDYIYHRNDLLYNVFYFDNIGDHKNIILNLVNEKHEHEKLEIKSYKKINNNHIASLKLLDEINTDSFDTYIDEIQKIIIANTVEIKIKPTGRKPFVSQRILNIITIRNKYLKLKLKFPDSSYFKERFDYYRSLSKKEIRKAKKDYFDEQFAKNIQNPRKTWQQLNTLIYNKTSNYNSTCSLLVDNGISITQKESIADHLNNYFVKVSDEITSKININQSEHEYIMSSEIYHIKSTFACPAVTEDEIKLIIENLKSSNTLDIYGMSNSFVKFHKNSLLRNLAKLINKYMFQGIFPDVLKLGIVTPIYKNGSKTSCNNYRPITINPILGKIYEYVIYRRFQNHLDDNNVIHKNQFGYVKKSNCEIAAAHISNDIYSLVDERKSVSLTCIDLSKAFDCIQFPILIKKLRKLNLEPFFLNLLISYLNGRKQAVKIDESLSKFLLINVGSPQGGVLSGPFFDLYINSIFNLNLSGNLYLYCDDMSLTNEGNNTNELKINIENDLQLIQKWLNNHYLSPNIAKTKYVLFQGKKRFENFTELALNINFNGRIIERSESLKILGLTIDETMSFKDHVDELKKKITPFIYALRRARKFITDKTATELYYAHVQSHFVYMSTIWSGLSLGLMKSLEILQRKALRIVLKKNWFAGKDVLYNIKLLPVSVICETNSCLQVFKINKNIIKNNVEIRVGSDIHGHSTRNRENFAIKKCQTNHATQNFYIRAFSKYNELPKQIKAFHSLSIIKNRLKEHFLEIYFDAN